MMLRADMLYWMVNTDLSSQYAYATLYERTDASSDGVEKDTLVLTGDMAVDRTTTLISSGYENSLFYLELYSESTGSWVKSDVVNRNALADYIDGSGGSGMEPPAGYFSGWTVSSVPEPTSGLMLLLGTALLALRRKRA